MDITKYNENKIEILIDDLIPINNIKLKKYNNIILLENFNITNSTFSYKLINSDIYNLLLEQLNMNDSLVVYIINVINKNRYSIVINNITIYNKLIHIFNKYKDVYDVAFYGINLKNISIINC